MTLDEYISKYDGKGIDYDGKFGNQCVDNYRKYVQEVLGLTQSPPVVGAKDIYETYTKDFKRIANTPTGFPLKGDIIIWGASYGPFGHVAICVSANKTNFTAFSQNDPVGTLCGVKKYASYKGVLGWLHPKSSIITPDMPKWLTDLLKEDLDIDTSKSEGDIRAKVGEIKNTLNGYESLRKRVEQLEEDLITATRDVEGTKVALELEQSNRMRVEKELADLKLIQANKDSQISRLEEQVASLTAKLEASGTSTDNLLVRTFKWLLKRK